MKKLLMLGVMAIALSSCSSKYEATVFHDDKPRKAKEIKEINGRTFKPAKFSNVEISFYGDRVKGFTGVNKFNAQYYVLDGKITVRNILMTRNIGSIQQNHTEKEFLNSFYGTHTYEVKDKVLVINDVNYVDVTFMNK